MRRAAKKEGGGLGKAMAVAVAVAVDGDKSSQHALKWAADHVLSRGHPFFLLHVRRKLTSVHASAGKQFSTSHVQEDVSSSLLNQMDLQTKELLLPFQCFCSRRALQCKEIILDGTDVTKAIVHFVIHQTVERLVLGASSRNSFTRTLWKMDVPTSVSKAAPDFCSVYVIAKGKLSSIRPATQANVNDTSKEDFEADVYGNRVLAVKSVPGRKLHTKGPCPPRPIPVHRAKHINASSGEAAEEGCSRRFCQNHKSPDQQGHVNCSYPNTASCTSKYLTNTNQQTNYLTREYSGHWRDMLLLSYKDDEHTCHDPHDKYFRFDQPSVYDSAVPPGYNVLESLPRGSSGECTASISKYPTEDMEVDIRHLKLELKQKKGDITLWNYKELPPATVNRGLMVEEMDTQSLSEGNEPSQEFKEKRRSLESFSSDIQYRSPEAESGSRAVLDAENKLLPLGTFSSDTQCRGGTILEESDRSSQNAVQWKCKRLPPKCDTSIDHGRHVHVLEETHVDSRGILQPLQPKCNPLPKPIETKRMLEDLPTRFRCRIYTPEEIANVTEYFSTELKIGEGGYGPVYKATLDHTLVAVKILHSNITQGLKQFQQEVEVLSNIRHPNMVHLVGACPEYGCLVYQYMPNGSLEDRLFCRSGTPPLSWQLRFRIAVEIATGLLYLHQTKPEPLVHRDLKPGNILLDENYVGKIADVGLARIIPRSLESAVTQYRMTAAAGTFCYIDPEYQKTGLVSTNSDVYALGIIFLQMVTAKDAMGLAYNVSDALEEGTLKEILDPNVPDWPMDETQKFAELALKCCELRHRDRPDLESVVLPELIRLHTFAMSSEVSSVRSRRSAFSKRQGTELG